MPQSTTQSLRKPIGWRGAVKRMPGVQRFADWTVELESWWFDFSHNVDTSAELNEQQRRGWQSDKINFYYQPTRPKWVRRALGNIPAEVRNQSVFIDFGSGKGRVLMMASALGFRQLYGIELRKELHEQACRNFQRFRTAKGCRMESLHMDAATYQFPDEPLVLFFFNPFGGEVMEKVLGNLAASLERHFRDVWVILHGSVCAHLADQSPQLKLEMAQYGYRIYRSVLISLG